MMSQTTPPDTTGTPSHTTSSPYLEQLAQLASPVLDLAATLATPQEQEADDENVSFLRTRLPTPAADFHDHPAGLIDPATSRIARMPHSAAIPPLRDARTGQVISRTDSESQRRMRSSMAAQQVTSHNTDVGRTWASRITGQDRSSYAGWAPGSLDDEEEPYPLLSNNTQSSAEVYNEWSSRMRSCERQDL